MKTLIILIKSFFALALCLISHYNFATGCNTKAIDTTYNYYNIDGKSAPNLTLPPDQIAYMQVLDGKQAQIIFGPGYEKGVFYVTTKINKYTDVNTGLQDKIDHLFPPVGSYRGTLLYSGTVRSIVRGMELAERDKWLVVIDNKPSTLETLKLLSIKDITGVSYRGEDMSQAYGAGAKNGVLLILTSNGPGNPFVTPNR
jgi:hypothetical protein